MANFRLYLLLPLLVFINPFSALADQNTRHSVFRVKSAESGTGFVIFTEGRRLYMLTAGHVVAGRDPNPPPCSVDFGSDERSLPCRILLTFKPEEGVDLAVLEADASQVSGAFAAVRLGASQSLPHSGTKVYTYGYPAGGSLRREEGIISGASGANLVLNGIMPESGQSGSPVFDATNGWVIGMITNRARGRDEQFAVEIDLIKLFLARAAQFRSFMEVVRAPANAVGPLVASDLGPSLTTMFSAAYSPERWYDRSKRYARFDLDQPLLNSLQTWLGIKRVYVSSRSSKLGRFGYGWSSTTDYQIDLETSTLCRLFVWNPQGVRLALESVIDCAEAKRSLSAHVSDPKLLDGSLQTLLEYPDIANRVLPDSGPSYVGGDFDVVRAKFIPVGIEFGIGSTKYQFNSRGQLRTIQAGHRLLTLDYDLQNRILVIRDGDQGQQYNYNSAGLVSSVSFTDGTKYDYQYDNEKNLISVDRLGVPLYKYDYDHSHRLTSFSSGRNAAPTLITYQPDTGWRESIKRNNQEYRWEFGGDPANGLPAVIQTITTGDDLQMRHYFFDYQGKRLDIEIDGTKTSYTLTQCLCLPLRIEKAGNVTAYEYDTFGRIVSVKTPREEMRQSYDNVVNKINRIEKRDGDSWHLLATASYDDFGNLIYAKAQDQGISLNYTRNGSIRTIDNGSGEEVRIEYEDRFGKPSIISQGNSSIRVSYDEKGELQSVDSPGGPSVAVRVASAFNDLLTAISPFNNAIRPKTDYDLLTSEPGGCSECVASLQF